MTLLEKASLSTLTEIMAYFEKGYMDREAFRDLMGHVRDTIKHFELTSLGCPTGTHAGHCTCKPAVIGVAVDVLKARNRNR